MAAEPEKSENDRPAGTLAEALGAVPIRPAMVDEAAKATGINWAARNVEIQKIIAEARAKPQLAEALRAIAPPPSEAIADLRKTVIDLAVGRPSPMASRPAAAPPARPRQAAPLRRVTRIPQGELIARRVIQRQRKSVIAFFKEAGLGDAIKELGEVEKRLQEDGALARRHAAFSARTLLEGLADHLFPPSTEQWCDRNGQKHAVTEKRHKNRLSAYVDARLRSELEAHDHRAFQGVLDVVMRWTGSGPHGACSAADADHAYTRLLEVLAVIARAYRAK